MGLCLRKALPYQAAGVLGSPFSLAIVISGSAQIFLLPEAVSYAPG